MLKNANFFEKIAIFCGKMKNTMLKNDKNAQIDYKNAL